MNEEAKLAKIVKDEAKINHYLQLKSEVFKVRDEQKYSIDMLNKVTDLIVLNPEFYTVWNIRRETLMHLFQHGHLDKTQTLQEDLKLVMMLFRRFPKCYWIFNHRLWCLKQLGDKANWEFELGIVSKLLSADQRNFHGWQLRRVVTENLENRVSSENESVNLLLINLNEYEFTTSKINNNISNFSAWHNRSQLIPKIYKMYQEIPNEIDNKEIISKYRDIFSDPFNILMHEMKLINTGMYVDVDDTSIWLYLYWLIADEFFIKNIKVETYKQILEDQLKVISELNELEKSENGIENCWCLKSIILIKGLMGKLSSPDIPNFDLLTDEMKSMLKTLMEIDPLRKGRYLDQLNGKAQILYQ